MGLASKVINVELMYLLKEPEVGSIGITKTGQRETCIYVVQTTAGKTVANAHQRLGFRIAQSVLKKKV